MVFHKCLFVDESKGTFSFRKNSIDRYDKFSFSGEPDILNYFLTIRLYFAHATELKAYLSTGETSEAG